MPNTNSITTDTFSNPESETLYRDHWPREPGVYAQYEDGLQCGGCAFYAPFNADYGLCCNPASRHRLETVFEHFTCPAIVNQGWGAHSFHEPRTECYRCGGFGDAPCFGCADRFGTVPPLSTSAAKELEPICWKKDCGMPLDHPAHMDLGTPGQHAFVPAGIPLPIGLTEPPICPSCGLSLSLHARGRACPEP